MKPVMIVGAGFSGLTLAFALRQLGLPVKIIERAETSGGLISTRAERHGLVETAANALLADAEIERLFTDLNLDFAARLPARRRRFIFWQKPRRWPLAFGTTVKLLKMYLFNFLALQSVLPKGRETVSAWARRVVNAQFEERLLAPALQGVYAGDPNKMSACLTLSALFVKPKRGRWKGSVAPKQGMGELIDRLTDRLREMGVEMEYGKSFALPEKLEQPTVICTSAWAAAEILRDYDPALCEILGRCESLPLVTVTAFFPPHKSDTQGFGCLFPRAQGFRSLGVLFNDCIFAGRSSQRSETWILGGAENVGVTEMTDAEIQQAILADRMKISGHDGAPLAMHITRWPRALPHYTVEWEESLRHIKVNRPLFLHGNFLGQLGLSRVYQRSKALALQIKDLYVS